MTAACRHFPRQGPRREPQPTTRSSPARADPRTCLDTKGACSIGRPRGRFSTRGTPKDPPNTVDTSAPAPRTDIVAAARDLRPTPTPGDGRAQRTRAPRTTRARIPLSMHAYQRDTTGSLSRTCSSISLTVSWRPTPRQYLSTRRHHEAANAARPHVRGAEFSEHPPPEERGRLLSPLKHGPRHNHQETIRTATSPTHAPAKRASATRRRARQAPRSPCDAPAHGQRPCNAPAA